MTPLRLKLRGFRSFADLDLDMPAGCVGLVGDNGAGKSSVLVAIEVALFGPRSRSLEPLLRQGDDELEIELTFEHARDWYRVRRSFVARGRGKSTLDLEYLDGGQVDSLHDLPDPVPIAVEWETLSQGSAADTQALIERTLGLTRDTFLASSYLAQGDTGAFTEAQPKDRKRILADALALTLWDEAALAVAADRRVASSELAAIEGRIGSLAERVQAAAGIGEQRETAAARLAEFDQRAAETDRRVTVLEERHEQARAADEQWRARSAAVRTAEQFAAGHRKLAVEAQVARERLDGERTFIGRFETLAAEHTMLTEQVAELEQRDAARAEAIRERDRLLADHGRLVDAADRHERALEQIDAKHRAIQDDPHAICDRCEQHLPDDARKAALASLATEQAAVTAALADARDQANAAHRAIDDHEVPPPVTGLDEIRARLTEIRSAPSDLAAARARISELERATAILDDPAYLAEQERLDREEQQAREQLNAIHEPEPGLVDHTRATLLEARAAQEAARAEQQTLGRDLARLEALADAARADADQLDIARAERDQLAARHDDLALLERAFGRDGVPAWIVEHHALPAIETEANRILQLLGGPVSAVELRTERELKTGGTADALDIVCLTDDGARDYATFSGGERTRIGLALRVGLARLLAHRASEIRVLLLDEPDGLDAAGTEALAGILRDLVQRAELEATVLASHDTNLRDRFDQALIVERDDSGSRVAVA